VVCFLENDPRSDDFPVSGVGDRDCCRFSDCWGGGEDVLDSHREKVLFYDEVNEEGTLRKRSNLPLRLG